MNASTAYHDLAGQHEPLLQAVTQRATKAVAIQRLYLLGLTKAIHHTQSLFAMASAYHCDLTHGHFLAMVDGDESKNLSGVQDKLEAHLAPVLPATVIVLSETSFTRWLPEGHRFACTVYRYGHLLYQDNGLPLIEATMTDEESIQKEKSLLLRQAESKVQAFLAGAELYTLRLQYGLAAFLLHQAAEQALSALLTIHTGLRLNTHSIDRLLCCCFLFCPKLQAIFPRRSEKDKRLFALLQKAYIEARYKAGYTIRFDELAALTGKVKQLHDLFEQHGL